MSDVPQYPVYVPKSFGQILDRVFRLLRANLKLFVGIAVLPPAAMFLSLGSLFGGIVIPFLANMPKNPTQAQNAQMGYVVLPAMLSVFVAFGVVFAPSFAAVSKAAVQADLGIHVTFREAYASAFRRFWRFLLLLILIFLLAMSPMMLIQLAVFFVTVLIGHGGTPHGPAIFVLIPISILLALACSAFSIIVTLRLSLVYPACVTEELTAVSALKRSYQLTRGAMGRIFLTLLVIYAIGYLVYLVAMCGGFIAFTIISLVESVNHHQVPLPVQVILIGGVGIGLISVMVLYMAVSWTGNATALAVIYNDQRMRIDRAPSTIAPTGALV